MANVALSGVSGGIGQVLRPALLKLGFGLQSAGGRRVPPPVAAQEDAKPNPPNPLTQRLQGGGFVTIDYTPPEQRPTRIGH